MARSPAPTRGGFPSGDLDTEKNEQPGLGAALTELRATHAGSGAITERFVIVVACKETACLAEVIAQKHLETSGPQAPKDAAELFSLETEVQI